MTVQRWARRPVAAAGRPLRSSPNCPQELERAPPLALLRRLGQKRRVVRQGRPPHVPDFAAVKSARSVHGDAIVPDDEIMRPPDMRIDKFPLRCVLGQVAQEYLRLRYRPADNRAGMGGEKQGFPAGPRMFAHQWMTHGAEVRFLRFGELGEADRGARIDQRVLANEVLDLGFRSWV